MSPRAQASTEASAEGGAFALGGRNLAADALPAASAALLMGGSAGRSCLLPAPVGVGGALLPFQQGGGQVPAVGSSFAFPGFQDMRALDAGLGSNAATMHAAQASAFGAQSQVEPLILYGFNGMPMGASAMPGSSGAFAASGLYLNAPAGNGAQPYSRTEGTTMPLPIGGAVPLHALYHHVLAPSGNANMGAEQAVVLQSAAHAPVQQVVAREDSGSTPADSDSAKSSRVGRRHRAFLYKTHPQIAAEWHPVKNATLRDRNGELRTPQNTTPGIRARVWWRCTKYGHEWEAKVYNRTNARTPRGCPHCYRLERSRSKAMKSTRGRRARTERANAALLALADAAQPVQSSCHPLPAVRSLSPVFSAASDGQGICTALGTAHAPVGTSAPEPPSPATPASQLVAEPAALH